MTAFGRDLLAGLADAIVFGREPYWAWRGGGDRVGLLVVHTLLQAVFALAAVSLLSGSLDGDPRGTIRPP